MRTFPSFVGSYGMNDTGSDQSHRETLADLRTRVVELEAALARCQDDLGNLRRSEERSRVLFEQAPDGVYVCDLMGTFLDGNRAAEKIVGYPREELIGKSFLKLRLLSKGEIVKASRLLLQSARGQPTGPEVFTLHRKDGTLAIVEIRTHPIELHGQPRVLGIARDITHYKELEAALARAEERYSLAVSAGRAGVWDWDPGSDEMHIDAVLKAMLGFEVDEIGNHMDEWKARIHPEDSDRVMAAMAAHLEGPDPHFEVEHRMRCKDGSVRWYLSRGSAFHDLDGQPYRMVGTSTDITERREAEERLRRSLREKDVLLKEIHHRVKNNLQVVSSMLRLQEVKEGDERLKSLLRDVRSRIYAMGSAHERLYHSADLAEIDLAPYLEDLAGQLVQTRGTSAGVHIHTDLEPISLSVDTAICLGLIVNELVASSLSHSLVDRSDGRLSIALSRLPEGDLLLTIADNGCGPPRDVDWRHSPSLGFSLVSALVSQLRGELELHDQEEGTCYRLRIPASRNGLRTL